MKLDPHIGLEEKRRQASYCYLTKQPSPIEDIPLKQSRIRTARRSLTSQT
jgi:hypothetical protein